MASRSPASTARSASSSNRRWAFTGFSPKVHRRVIRVGDDAAPMPAPDQDTPDQETPDQDACAQNSRAQDTRSQHSHDRDSRAQGSPPSRPAASLGAAVTAVVAVVAMVAASVVAAGCSGDDGATGEPSTTTTSPAPETTDPRLERELAAEPDTAAFDFTQEVSVTAAGFVPATAVAVIGEEVVIRNDSDAPLTVEFVNGPIDEADTRSTGELAPGAEFRFTPTRVTTHSMRVAGAGDLRGVIQVDEGEFEG